MNGLVRILVVLLPLVGLGGLWAWSDYAARDGVEWQVPIEGYDPRDLLRGHYVQFRYDWPGLREDGETSPQSLCLYGQAPQLEYVERLEDALEECDNIARADLGSIYGADSLVRGRIYLEQHRAIEMDKTLRDRELQGIVTIRLSESGTITPVEIDFYPRDNAATVEMVEPVLIEDMDLPEGEP